MTLGSGVGSLPGGSFGEEAENARLFTEWTRAVFGTLDMPHLVELPGRGAIANMTGRTLGLIQDLGADLQPSGWRLTDAAGVDQRRARSLIGQDLDTVEEIGQDFAGFFKTQICGPWTLAATVGKPRGDLVLSDVGARRDLSQVLALAAAEHVAEVRRRVPNATVLLQLDEPALPAVLAGQVPTSSGFSRLRSIHPPEASEMLQRVIEATDADVLVHCCASELPGALLRGAGASGLSVDVGALAASSYDAVAEVVEAGDWFFAGTVPVTEQSSAEPVTIAARFFDMLALSPSERIVITPTCGLAASSVRAARAAMSESVQTARRLNEAG